MPFGTDLIVAPTNLFISNNATISPAPDSEQNFSSPVDYIVTAENGDPQTWRVTVNVEADTRSGENDITRFTLSPTSGDSALDLVNHTATITVPFGTDLIVAPTNLFISNNATVSPAPDSEQNFSSPVDYTVTAENGDPQTWRVTVNVEADTRSGENDITRFTLSPTSGDSALDLVNHTATITVPFGTDLIVAPTNLFISNNATVSPAPDSEQNFSSPVDYVVTAENGDPQTWRVTVNVQADPRSGENDIVSFNFPRLTGPAAINTTDHTVVGEVPFGANRNASPISLTVSAGATINPQDISPQNFANLVPYTVTAENGDPQIWTVTINEGAAPPPSASFSGGTNIDSNGAPGNSVSGTLTITGGAMRFRVSATLIALNTGEGEGMVRFTVSSANGGSWEAFISRPIGTANTIETGLIPPNTYNYTLEFVDRIGQASGSVRAITN